MDLFSTTIIVTLISHSINIFSYGSFVIVNLNDPTANPLVMFQTILQHEMGLGGDEPLIIIEVGEEMMDDNPVNIFALIDFEEEMPDIEPVEQAQALPNAQN